ncbi:MAG: Transcription-repair coupling factor [Parcubacteria group bacterium GW2011_GWB1_43_6]|nr:MAG: Transcription-repair coupling factor [Parcubacteria group bacterium GW2011_GWB1_43_6]
MSSKNVKEIFIASITPYFLERGNLWFAENLEKILEAKKSQSFFEDNTLLFARNREMNFSQVLRKLDEMGYEKVQSVAEPGEFSRRGGTIDIFPLNYNNAFRIDFDNNLIENIEQLPIAVADEQETRERIKRKLKRQKLYSQLGTLKPGDYLVHLDHGVGIYGGRTSVGGPTSQYYVLEYAQSDKLYVPVGLERKLSRYVGFQAPAISRLSSQVWERTKRRVKEETEKLARELLEIYAKREIAARPYYLSDTEIDVALTDTFPYEETPDQIQAIEDIKKELETSQIPLDRIVCGDVGFGKTEVALRIMVKAVNSGFQAALICPTTILASQHFQTFEKRLGGLPIKFGLLSRLQTKKEQQVIIQKLKLGQIDIVIGTHRVLSNDVEFKNLGLLAIDDEQRFGVKQKEKLKKIRASLDILSLSATPIPRTLYLALSSLKKISIIQTPPAYRLPIKTIVKPWSEKIIKKAIANELSRGGQIYYLHNRVETIGSAKELLQTLIPEIRIGVIHGRLPEKELIKIMDDLGNKKIDVLVATTIIENGLDVPNVNALIVADAPRLGLSQAYQIRGRVGRSHIQAFAYFFYGDNLSDLAKERLKALKEAQELGSGYRIAMRDLEIRGAGNILGKEQSGSINQVGLNLYCQILSDAIDKLKKS